MKKTLLTLLETFAVVSIGYQAFATGDFPNNTPQSGSAVYTVSTGLATTNSFAIPFTQTPIITVSPASGTNDLPFTVSSQTISNFVLTVSASTTTNQTVNWIANLGYPRMFIGTNAVTGGAPVTNTYPVAFAYLPTVNVEGDSTNAFAVPAVISSTTTGNIIRSTTSVGVSWSAIGISATPGTSSVTY